MILLISKEKEHYFSHIARVGDLRTVKIFTKIENKIYLLYKLVSQKRN